jgi:RNA polymerase sigma-70 factor (ECF subfamily)
MTHTHGYLEELVRTHWRELVSMLTVITRNPATAEDLAQEVFLVAHRKELRPGPGVRAWLRRTARFLALNELRRKRPLAVDPASLSQWAGDAADEDAASPGFEDRLAALRHCLAELAPADRELLAERYRRQTPLAQVSDRLGQSVGYLKQRLFRLRRRLARCIALRLATPETTHDHS